MSVLCGVCVLIFSPVGCVVFAVFCLVVLGRALVCLCVGCYWVCLVWFAVIVVVRAVVCGYAIVLYVASLCCGLRVLCCCVVACCVVGLLCVYVFRVVVLLCLVCCFVFVCVRMVCFLYVVCHCGCSCYGLVVF